MSRILLADDSPHAQRMGEFILTGDGYEVVSVTDGETALVRLDDVDPDLVLADVSLPGKSGYEICDYVKNHPRRHHVAVLLTAGAMEPIDEQEAQRVRADGSIRKPFEASVVLAEVKRLVEAARQVREPEVEPAASLVAPPAPAPEPESQAAPEFLAPTLEALPETPAPVDEIVEEPLLAFVPAGPAVDPQSVRAAVTLALEAALPVLIDEVTQQVLLALVEDTNPPEAPGAAEAASAD